MGLGNGCALSMEVGEMAITTVNKVELLGVIIDSKLKLGDHVESLCLESKQEF